MVLNGPATKRYAEVLAVEAGKAEDHSPPTMEDREISFESALAADIRFR